jgi:hypothetical protein
MADTYNWGIATLERHLNGGVVYTAHWTVSAERTSGEETFNASAYGSIGLAEPDPQAFIPYENLTFEIVIDWVKEKLGEEQVESMESALSAQLDQQQTPKSAQGVPW